MPALIETSLGGWKLLVGSPYPRSCPSLKPGTAGMGELGTFPMKAQAHSPTSLAAAEHAEPKSATLRRVVLDYIRSQGRDGATDEQVQNALAMNPSTQRPRRVELVEGGFVVDSGGTRKTASGRNAVVWVAAEFVKREPAKQMEFAL